MKKTIKNLLAIAFTLLLTAFVSNSVSAEVATGTSAAVGGSYLYGAEKMREIFKALQSNGSLKNKPIMEHFLRQEVILEDLKGDYVFDYRKQNSSTSNKFINLLDNNDVFIATYFHLGFYEADSTKPGQVLGPIQTGIRPLGDYWTTAASSPTFNPQDLYQFYCGKLKFKNSTEELFQAVCLLNNFYEHEKQGDLASGVSQGVGKEDGMQDFAIFPILNGASETQLETEAPIYTGIRWEQDAANKLTKAVITLHGVIIKNVTGSEALVKEISRVAASFQ